MKKSHKPTPRQIQDWNINSKLGKGSQPEVMEIGLRLPKEMSSDSIHKAYQALLKRHKILRTYFPLANGEVKQVVDDYNPETFALTDLNSCSWEHIMEVQKETWSQLKDIKKPPLIYSALWHRDTDLVFLILIHHILCDAWSRRILLKELEELCFHFHSKTPVKLESKVVQLADYYELNQDLIDKTEDDNLAYWKSELSDKSWQVDFNRVYNRCLGDISSIDKVKKFRGWEKLNHNDFYSNSSGEVYSTNITGELYEKLKIFSSETRLGISSILIGCMSILGMELSGNENILLRMLYHGRDDNTAKIVGHLVGCMLMYFKLNKHNTFRNAILNYYDTFSKSNDKVIFQSEKLEKLDVTSRCFSSFNFIGKELVGNNPISAEDQKTKIEGTQTMRCPLHFTAIEYTNTIYFSCSYHLNYYDSDIVTSMFERYLETLKYMITYPDKKLGDFVKTDSENWSRI